jgi:hypothetical protein
MDLFGTQLDAQYGSILIGDLENLIAIFRLVIVLLLDTKLDFNGMILDVTLNR